MDAAVARLRAAKTPWTVVAAKVGVDYGTLARRRVALGGTIAARRDGNWCNAWPAQEVAVLVAAWGRVPCAEIGRRVGRSKDAVIGKAHRLNLPPPASRVQPLRWSDHDRMVLICGRNAGHSWTQIGLRVGRSGAAARMMWKRVARAKQLQLNGAQQ